MLFNVGAFVMKTFSKSIVMSLAFSFSISAQIDTTLKDYFPMEIGNIWEYEEDSFPDYWHHQIITIGDTIMPNGKVYFVYFNTGTHKKEYFRIDDSLNIYSYKNGNCYQQEMLFLKLTTADRTVWDGIKIGGINCTDTTYGKIGLFRSFEQFYPKLSLNAKTKLFTEVVIKGADTNYSPLIPKIDFIPTRLAKGIGKIWTQFEGPASDLVGAIIGGKKIGNITSVKQVNDNQVPQSIEIKNYPNPFNSSTTITVKIDKDTDAQISIFNILGQEVTRLMEGFIESGAHRFRWDGKTNGNIILPSGIYFCLLRTKNASKISAISLIK